MSRSAIFWLKIVCAISGSRSPSFWPKIAIRRPTRSELVFVDYEPLEVVTDIEAALHPDAPLVYPEIGTNIAFLTRSGNIESEAQLESIFASADHVVNLKAPFQRLVGHAMEPRTALANVDAEGNLTVWISTQTPHLDKNDFVLAQGFRPKRSGSSPRKSVADLG